MDDLARLLKEDGPSEGHPYRRPRDAATLILVDRTASTPQVLLGRRHHGHVFMPGKYVFPGGRVEPSDRFAPFAAPLDVNCEAHLMARVGRSSPTKARALALAAVRETYEETGLLLGTRGASSHRGKSSGPWKAFSDAGVLPDLKSIAFVARAITPTGRSRRYDTRFFTADASSVAHRIEGMVGAEAELVELVWVPIDETQHLDLPGITRRVLRELQDRIAAGFGHDLPVPFFHTPRGKLLRELI